MILSQALTPPVKLVTTSSNVSIATPPNFEIFLIDKKSTVCYRKLHFLRKVGLGGSIGEDGISFFQFFEKKLTISIHLAQKNMIFSRKKVSKKWVKLAEN